MKSQYRKKVIYKKSNPLNTVQYILSIIIVILFTIALIPTYYDDIFPLISIIILVQLILSTIRFRIFGFVVELGLIVLSVAGAVPVLGYIFRVIGFFLSFIDLLLNKSPVIYKKITVVTKNNFSKKNKKQKKFNSEKIQDAEFKEK